jgi:hypothetical protein
MPEVVAPIVSVVARRIHDRMYPGTSASCTICPELASIAVDAVLTELAAAGRLLPEGATTQVEFEIVWYFAVLLPIRWGCDSLERARKAASEPPAGAVRGEIRSQESWIGGWSVVEPVAVKEASDGTQ